MGLFKKSNGSLTFLGKLGNLGLKATKTVGGILSGGATDGLFNKIDGTDKAAQAAANAAAAALGGVYVAPPSVDPLKAVGDALKGISPGSPAPKVGGIIGLLTGGKGFEVDVKHETTASLNKTLAIFAGVLVSGIIAMIYFLKKKK